MAIFKLIDRVINWLILCQSGGADILTFHNGRRYRLATAFALAYPYGFTRIMSSYLYRYTQSQLSLWFVSESYFTIKCVYIRWNACTVSSSL